METSIQTRHRLRQMWPSNRTSLEWKRICSSNFALDSASASNRTSLEWKRTSLFALLGSGLLLIEPVWNGNVGSVTESKSCQPSSNNKPKSLGLGSWHPPRIQAPQSKWSGKMPASAPLRTALIRTALSASTQLARYRGSRPVWAPFQKNKRVARVSKEI